MYFPLSVKKAKNILTNADNQPFDCKILYLELLADHVNKLCFVWVKAFLFTIINDILHL